MLALYAFVLAICTGFAVSVTVRSITDTMERNRLQNLHRKTAGIRPEDKISSIKAQLIRGGVPLDDLSAVRLYLDRQNTPQEVIKEVLEALQEQI
jgi:hypothetical protein